MLKLQLCLLCIKAREDPLIHVPRHLVHPITHEVGLFDVRSEAICVICNSRWRRERNVITLLST